MCVGVLPACMFGYHMCTWYSKMPEKGIRSSRAGVTSSCEPCDMDSGNQTCRDAKAALATELSLQALASNTCAFVLRAVCNCMTSYGIQPPSLLQLNYHI